MKSYRLLLFSDYHISSKGRRTLRRLDECVRTAHWIAEEIKASWPDYVINLGDSFDQPTTIDTPSLCTGIRIMETIQNAAKSCLAKFIIIPGNHDAYSMDYSSLEAFQALGIDVVWKPTIYDGRIGALPFNKNAEMATKWIKELEPNCHVVMAHLDVKHAQFFSGGPDSNIGVCADDFRRPIFCGHYHHPHSLGAFEFIGSVMHHNFSDRDIKGHPRGLVIVDIDEAGVIKKAERRSNPHTTVYHKVDWSKKQERLRTIKLYGAYQDRMHLRVKCDHKLIADVKEEIAESFPKLVSLSVVGISSDTDDVKREASVKIDANPLDALKAYLKNKGIPSGLDEKKLLAVGEDFLSE